MSAYCPRCGEKRRQHDDWKLRNIADETFAELINVEHSKLWQTLRLLLFKPGQLTRDYWAGRRQRFIGPVKLYLAFFALSLVLFSIHRPTAIYDVRMFAANPQSQISRRFDEMAQERGMSTAQFAQAVNSRWQNYFSMSQLAYPLMMALVLRLLFLGRSRYFAEHLIFALHLLAFMFLLPSLMWPLYFLFRIGDQTSIGPLAPGYLLLTGASLVWTIGYLFLAMRRAYAESWPRTVAKGTVVYLTYFVTTMAFVFATLALAVRLTRAGE